MSLEPRFREASQPEWFLHPTLVSCPRCGGLAMVETLASDPADATARETMHARLACGGCGYALNTAFDDARWAGPVHVAARTRCARCGRTLHRNLGVRASAPASRTTTLVCPGCEEVNTTRVHISPAGCTEAIDWRLGLELWLQAPCCGHVLWALNAAHLTFLANYVGATLREREPNRNRSAVSRLPSWMKQARHRAAVLATIERLRETLVRPELRRAVG